MGRERNCGTGHFGGLPGWSVTFARELLRVGLMICVGIAGAATPPLPRAPSPSHTPLVANPAPDDAPGYRAELLAITERYTQRYYSSDLLGALAEARTGLARAEKAGNRPDAAQFLKAAGYVTWLLGDTAASIEYEQRLLTLADALDDDRLRSAAHRTLGTVYRQISETAKAREHTDLALQFAERTGDETLRYGVINNQAVFAMDAGDLVTARRLHEQVLAFRERQGEPWDIAGTLSNLADVSKAERKLDDALLLHQRALALRRQVGDRRGVVRSLRQVAGILRALGRTDEALAHLAEALTDAERITGNELLHDIWQETALAHEARGEFSSALTAERRAGQHREALAGERARDRIAELQTRFDDARKEATIARLEDAQRLQTTELRAQDAELDRARLRNYLLTAGLAGGGFLLLVIIWLQRARLRAERGARDTAEQATALKTRLLRMVSHDIRGPIDGMLQLTEELGGAHPAIATDVRYDVVLSQGRQVLHLAEDLLDAAALEAGQLKLECSREDLATVVHTALAPLHPIAGRKNQSLEYTAPPPGACLVTCDGQRLSQVVANLVGNAIKFSPRNSTITVTLEKQSGVVRLRVSDRGPGIAPDKLASLFVPFTRLSAHPTGRESSHGLGLSIAHDLVKLHGGRIVVDSPPGRGATFIVELPASV